MEDGRNFVDAATRELREETGLEVRPECIEAPRWRRQIEYVYRGVCRHQRELVALVRISESSPSTYDFAARGRGERGRHRSALVVDRADHGQQRALVSALAADLVAAFSGGRIARRAARDLEPGRLGRLNVPGAGRATQLQQRFLGSLRVRRFLRRCPRRRRARRHQHARDRDVVGSRARRVTPSFGGPHAAAVLRTCRRVDRLLLRARSEHVRPPTRPAIEARCNAVTPSWSRAFGSNPHVSMVSSTAASPRSAGTCIMRWCSGAQLTA